MDLYGDLPPALSDAGKSNERYTLLNEVHKTNNQIETTKTNNQIETTKTNNPPVSKTSKLTASASLAFKPRQTTHAVHAVKPSVISHSDKPHVSMVVDSNSSIHSTVAYQNTSDEIFSNSNTSIRADDEFNNNASFDVIDSYDPLKPNDYIAYCEERLEQRKQLRLQEENKKRMEEMEATRAALEKERREAAQRGDFQALLNSGDNSINVRSSSGISSSTVPAMMGRGRGRSLANLPAWMTQKMSTSNADDNKKHDNATSDYIENEREQHLNTDKTTHYTSTMKTTPAVSALISPSVLGVKRKPQQGLFSKPSCVLLLKNMVGPNEVDDQLAAETKQECLKYGPIADCIVYCNTDKARKCPEEESVRTFVYFERQESAVKAYRDLNGRFFAGRQISASFYEEEKFRRKDLAPTTAEVENW